jgi:hypothetical protein
VNRHKNKQIQKDKITRHAPVAHPNQDAANQFLPITSPIAPLSAGRCHRRLTAMEIAPSAKFYNTGKSPTNGCS